MVERNPLDAGLIVVAVVVAVLIWVLSFVQVDDAGRTEVLVEVGKLSAQFLVVVLLGLLVTSTVKRIQAQKQEQDALRQRREALIRRLIDLTHEVDLARLLISANRSVKTWSEQMILKIIPAFTELRDLAHDLKTAEKAGTPIFDSTNKICKELTDVNVWFNALCDEFANNKKELSELQRQAERDRERQTEVWAKMQRLPLLEDLTNERQCYEWFRQTCHWVLITMRSELPRRKGAHISGLDDRPTVPDQVSWMIGLGQLEGTDG